MPHPKGFPRRFEGRSSEPVALGAVVDRLMLEGMFARGVPIATLSSRWPELVGQRLASETAPLSLESGVLTIGVTNGPWGAQARFLDEQIRKRADDALGGGAVSSVRIVVTDPTSPRNRR
jgi:hypothetical protein